MIIKPAGFERLTDFFEDAARSGALSHAYIIEGDEGAGKKTLAAYFAAVSVCAERSACGECVQCRQTAAATNADIIKVSSEGKASVGIEKVRELNKSLSLKSTGGGNRCVIVEDADLLTHQAQNALLKIIEEPPAGTIFLLLCKRSATMLRTVLSRAQVLKIPPLSVDILKKIAPGCSDFEYTYCGGNPGRLIKISLDSEFKQFRASTLEVLHRFFTGSSYALYEAADFFELHKDRKSDLFNITTLIIRDVIYKKTGLDRFIVNADKQSIINAIAGKVTLPAAVSAVQAVAEAESLLGRNGNYNLAVQSMLIRCRSAVENETQEEF